MHFKTILGREDFERQGKKRVWLDFSAVCFMCRTKILPRKSESSLVEIWNGSKENL